MRSGCLKTNTHSDQNDNFLLLILALLVGNTAGSLASGLARGLALAAATVLNGLCDILGLNGLNSAHDSILRI